MPTPVHAADQSSCKLDSVCYSYLSFNFATECVERGTALVDTPAQHGLVETIADHALEFNIVMKGRLGSWSERSGRGNQSGIGAIGSGWQMWLFACANCSGGDPISTAGILAEGDGFCD